ncbi:hypothetical protein FQA47_021956 [Oryzias melastigma]|uniref:Uncharacterized protein n=1 Tax=Oryzias melastigma TaxID=30732 RepID=A0A834C8U7_ORYME|nr:hypothetical protein FQA47_021956 [Oryzias melastigma]
MNESKMVSIPRLCFSFENQLSVTSILDREKADFPVYKTLKNALTYQQVAKPPSIKPIRSQRGVLRAGHSEERESRDKKSRRKTREAQRQRGGRWSGGTATGRQTGGGGGAQRLLPHCSFVSESGNFLEAELRSELGGLGRGRKWRKELPLLPAETRTRLSASWSEVKPGGGALPVRARGELSAQSRAPVRMAGRRADRLSAERTPQQQQQQPRL